MYRLWMVYVNIVTLYLTRAADLEYLKTTIADHFSDTRHHDPTYSDYKNQSKQFIYREFARFGLDTEYHTFQDTSVSSTETFHTVVGILNGTNIGTSKDKIIGLGAHYDTVSTTKGVDDNGSGVAALLDVVRQITNDNKPRKNTIIFVSFDLEEYGGLSGSRKFVQSWFSPWLDRTYGTEVPENIHGFIILDTIMEYNTSISSQEIPTGAESFFQQVFPDTIASITSDNFRGDYLTLIYRNPRKDSNLAALFTSSWSDAGKPEYELEPFALPFEDYDSLPNDQKFLYKDFMRSDHTNFWANNYSAIFLTDSANLRGDMIQCYHNPCDNADVLLTDENIKFLGKSSDAIALTIDKLSESTDSDSGSRMLLSPGTLVFIIIITEIVTFLS